MLTDKSTKQLSAMGLIASFNCVALMSSDVYASSIEATKLQSVVMSEKTQTDTVLEGIRGRLRGEPGQTHLIYLNQHENEFRSVIEEKWSKPYTAAYCDFLDRNFKADEMTQISKFFETPAGRYFTQ